MVLRAECLFQGEIIGIESIYTLVNGKQINIPDRVESLREKGRSNQLFCSCGCGSNLVLVAGDNSLRKQHFRLKAGTEKSTCSLVSEGFISIESKKMLKLWLDDKLNHPSFKYRVPISGIVDNERNYEITLLAVEPNIGISYCHSRANLSDDKLNILDQYKNKLKLLFITDISNATTEGQYPEWMMKIQNRQNYCLFLTLGQTYADVKMTCGLFISDLDGLWRMIVVSEAFLSEYYLDTSGNLSLNGNAISNLVDDAKGQFSIRMENEQKSREEQRIARQREQELKAEWERERRFLNDWEQAIRENNRFNQIQKENICKQENEKKALETKRTMQERKTAASMRPASLTSDSSIDEIREYMHHELNDTYLVAYNPVTNKRWKRCMNCGYEGEEQDFSSYRHKFNVNLGTCRACARKYFQNRQNRM